MTHESASYFKKHKNIRPNSRPIGRGWGKKKKNEEEEEDTGNKAMDRIKTASYLYPTADKD